MIFILTVVIENLFDQFFYKSELEPTDKRAFLTYFVNKYCQFCKTIDLLYSLLIISSVLCDNLSWNICLLAFRTKPTFRLKKSLI